MAHARTRATQAHCHIVTRTVTQTDGDCSGYVCNTPRLHQAPSGLHFGCAFWAQTPS